LLGDGDKGIETVNGEKKIILYSPTRAAKDEQNLLYLHDKPNEPTMEDSFHLHSFVSHSLQYQQSAGATLSSLSGYSLYQPQK
jgi:hypothetical protein